MSTHCTFKDAAPSPRASRRMPTYPRQIAMVGIALAMAGCMGAAPSPYGPGATQPEQQVLVPTEEPGEGNFAEPPPGEVPIAVDPEPEPEPEPEPQPAGGISAPYDGT